MSEKVEDFINSPDIALLEKYTKEQLLKIAEHYKINVSSTDKRLKDSVKAVLLEEIGVLMEGAEESVLLDVPVGNQGLTFEQRKELMMLQLEQEKMKWELEKEKNITERMKVELQHNRLTLVKEGRLGDDSQVSLDGSVTRFDVSVSLRLVPKFNERDPDTFFSLFERIADSRKWVDSERTLLLQCVLTGRAQEAYSALSATDCQVYSKVKMAVLKAYELVPEAYRQKFRTWKKGNVQTHVEFARELQGHFNRWCVAGNIKSIEELKDLIVLEQFKDSVPKHIATYVTEHKVNKVSDAAVLADEYTLIHKERFEGSHSHVGRGGSSFSPNLKFSGPNRDFATKCSECHLSGQRSLERRVSFVKGQRQVQSETNGFVELCSCSGTW